MTCWDLHPSGATRFQRIFPLWKIDSIIFQTWSLGLSNFLRYTGYDRARLDRWHECLFWKTVTLARSCSVDLSGKNLLNYLANRPELFWKKKILCNVRQDSWVSRYEAVCCGEMETVLGGGEQVREIRSMETARHPTYTDISEGT